LTHTNTFWEAAPKSLSHSRRIFESIRARHWRGENFSGSRVELVSLVASGVPGPDQQRHVGSISGASGVASFCTSGIVLQHSFYSRVERDVTTLKQIKPCSEPWKLLALSSLMATYLA